MSQSDHPPIHSPKGVEYWDEDLQEYFLDPTPDIHSRSDTPRVVEPWMKPKEEISDE